MTRKDYIVIAKILNNYKYRTREINEMEELIGELCIYFKQDNPNFDKYKFLEACGL